MAFMQPPPRVPAIGASVDSGLTTILMPVGSTASTFNVSTVVTSSMYLIPMYIDAEMTFTIMGSRITTSPGVGGRLSYAIYANDGIGRFPGTLLASTIDVLAEATGLAEGSISLHLKPQYVWVAIQRNTTGATAVSGYSIGDSMGRTLVNLSTPTTTSLTAATYYGSINTYGTFPANPTITSHLNTAVPIVYLR